MDGMQPLDDRAAVDDLFRVVYDELRTLARRQIARLNPGQTLSPTALVHDVYLRLADRSSGRLRDEQHFRALAARVMRQVIIDYIRRRAAQKRGAGIVIDRLVTDSIGSAATCSAEELLAIDEALVKLAALDARQAQIVELRYFGGLDVAETAHTLGLSERTVKREWQKARAFLYDALHS